MRRGERRERGGGQGQAEIPLWKRRIKRDRDQRTQKTQSEMALHSMGSVMEG